MPVRSLLMALYLTMLSSQQTLSVANRSTSSAKPIAPAVATSGWVTHVPVDVEDGLLQRHREEDGRHRVTLFHARAHPPDEPMD